MEEGDLKVATCIAEVGGIEVPHDDIILKDIQVCCALLSILLQIRLPCSSPLRKDQSRLETSADIRRSCTVPYLVWKRLD